MILTCPHCTARLQLEEAHLSAPALNIKCPRCQHMLAIVPVAAPPPMPPESAQAVEPRRADGALPSTETSDAIQMLATVLASALNRNPPASREETHAQRCVLACLVDEATRAKVRESLPRSAYELILAEAPEHAASLLQASNQIHVLLMDANYEAEQQGALTLLRVVNSLGLARRRRLYVVMVAANCRTHDTAGAFAQGVKLLVNPADLQRLPEVMEKSIRDFNLLYKAYNEAAGLSPF